MVKQQKNENFPQLVRTLKRQHKLKKEIELLKTKNNLQDEEIRELKAKQKKLMIA